jgi:hypothetical protein
LKRGAYVRNWSRLGPTATSAFSPLLGLERTFRRSIGHDSSSAAIDRRVADLVVLGGHFDRRLLIGCMNVADELRRRALDVMGCASGPAFTHICESQLRVLLAEGFAILFLFQGEGGTEGAITGTARVDDVLGVHPVSDNLIVRPEFGNIQPREDNSVAFEILGLSPSDQLAI